MSGILLFLWLTPLAGFLLLRAAPVQSYFALRLAKFLSTELNTEVAIGNFRLNWFLEIVISDLSIKDKHNNILLKADKIRADLKSVDVVGQKLVLNEILLKKGDINLVYYQSDSVMNLQFIIDYFAPDSVSTDTSSSKPWLLECSNLKITETHFAYRDELYISPGLGIDFSDLDFSDINLGLKNIQVSGDSLTADFQQFACNEKSGFSLRDFSTKAIVCSRGIHAKELRITTGRSRLSLDLKFEFNAFSAFNEFVDSIRISANFNPSQLDMQDIVSFAPDVYGMENIIDFSGKIRGTVSNFTARDFQFAFGDRTTFKGNIHMNGLPDIEETFVNLKIEELYTSYNDIQAFTVPYSDSINTINLPAELQPLGNIDVNGRFTGFFNDFVSKATFITDVGQLTTDILLTNNKSAKSYNYDGKILVEQFNAGKFFKTNKLGTLDLYTIVKGKNFSADKADLTFKSEITNLQYEGNSFALINVDGVFRNRKFTGGVFINDELVNLDFAGSVDFRNELPAFDFQANLERANLARLNLMADDSVAFLTTNTTFNFQGNTLDNLIGTLHFNNTSFTRGDKSIFMKEMTVNTLSLGNGAKRMELKNDFVDAVVTGHYTFDDMAEYLAMAFTNYLPSLTAGEKNQERINRGSFDYTVHLSNTSSVTDMFVPELKIHGNTVISGAFDPSIGLINLNGRSPLIQYGGFSMRNWALTANSTGKILNLKMECSQVDRSEKEIPDNKTNRIQQFQLNAGIADDDVNFDIGWDDIDKLDRNKADITGVVSFNTSSNLIIKVDEAAIRINDTLWKSLPGNMIVIDSSYFEARNFGFVNNNRKVVVNGIVSPDPLSTLVLSLDAFNLSNVDILTEELGFDMDGFLDGNVSVSELYSVPRITSDLKISKFGFNKEFLGDAIIRSEWDNLNSLLAIDLQVEYVGNVSTHYPIKVFGNIYPERDHDNFDLKVSVDNLKVGTLQPFLEDVFSRMRGYASGALTFTGDFSDPVLKGKLNLMRTELLIDYLRTSYSFTGDFNFDKDLMWFKDITITDSTFGKGVVSGKISHKAFSDWGMDISLTADNLSALNTPYSSSEVYYGKAKATGTMTLKGPDDNLVLKADLRSDKGTGIFIPISFARNIYENDFIKYKVKETVNKPGIAEVIEEPSILSVQLGLDVTRYADIGIILPYQMGTIDVRGNGQIKMGVDTRGEYSMFGQYTMDNGNFQFNFENILKKDFGIQKGGQINFNGSPYDADINLQAVYKVKTSMAGLPVPEQYKSNRVNVDCIVNLSNNLYNPDIKFSIALPDANDELKRLVFSLIDTSNAIEMNQQMISLLVLNTFSSTSGISSSGASLGLSTYEILSAQLSSMLSQISKDFDIGVNYRPGDQISPQELELALSTQLFDNRVTINGAVGNSYDAANQTNQFIGDVLVEVKITEDGRFRVKGFNRTNSAFDLYGYAPYTQGVGVLFRKEFRTIRDLLGLKKKPKLPENPEQTTGNTLN